MAYRSLLTAARLREVLHYNPDTGHFRWRSRRARQTEREVVGCVKRRRGGIKRLEIKIDGQSYQGNRLAWLYMTGEWPSGQIRYHNGDWSDTRWCNLYHATRRSGPLTARYLREILRYDPDSGLFVWIKRGSGRRLNGQAGFPQRLPDGKARIVISVGKKAYKAHRLAWLYMTGEWPTGEIDHRNGDPIDNRWANLRVATKNENRRNRGTPRNNSSGLVGAVYDRYWKRWFATIRGEWIGQFGTKEEAHEAYKKAALELYGEFAHSSLAAAAHSSSPNTCLKVPIEFNASNTSS